MPSSIHRRRILGNLSRSIERWKERRESRARTWEIRGPEIRSVESGIALDTIGIIGGKFHGQVEAFLEIAFRTELLFEHRRVASIVVTRTRADVQTHLLLQWLREEPFSLLVNACSERRCHAVIGQVEEADISASVADLRGHTTAIVFRAVQKWAEVN